MKYYKDNNGNVFAYELDGSQDHLIGDKVAMTAEEVEAHLNPPVVITIPQVVTMRQTRLALLQSNLLVTVDTAIASGTDEAMKIEWEYATEVRRDWASLITLSTSLGMTTKQLDDLFLLASTL